MEEPRRTKGGNHRHLLTEMIFLVISAVVSGAGSWTEIELFGKSQLEWLRKFTPFKSGIPSHDTLGRVFSLIDYEQFSNCFVEWVATISKLTEGEVAAIDGKRLRGSFDTAGNQKAIHMVSAFATINGLCLGQEVCEEKSNEITAIPKLLELLAIKGCVVTIDAMGCQTEIAESIIKKGADYILAVKQNQKELYEQIQKVFQITNPASIHTEVDSGHGRVEQRKCVAIDDFRFFDIETKWKGLKSILKIESENFNKTTEQLQKEMRYYISSLPADAKEVSPKIRSHWLIEHKLHWVLDVVFGEDASRKRKGNSAKNFNLISKIALSLIPKESTKGISGKGISGKGKRYKAALDQKFREKILNI